MSEKKIYECEKCNFETNVKQAYKNHLETEKHKTGKIKTRSDKLYPEKCELCNYKPYSCAGYVQHKLQIHASIEEKKTQFKFYCEQCNFGTYNELFFNKHISTKKHKMMMGA
jgi:hypothetical protein